MRNHYFTRERFFFFVFTVIILLIPDLILDFPLWVSPFLFIFISLVPYAGYAYILVWCYTASVVSKAPVDLLSIIFWVLFVLYCIYDLFAVYFVIENNPKRYNVYRYFPLGKGRYHLFLLRTMVFYIAISELPELEIELCQDRIMGLVDSLLKKKEYRREAAKWPDNFDYKTLGYKILYHICFSILSSGAVHLNRGFLSPEGDAIYLLFTRVLRFYEDEDLLENSCMEEQLDIIDDAIASVG